jgi:hypothetical protein
VYRSPLKRRENSQVSGRKIKKANGCTARISILVPSGAARRPIQAKLSAARKFSVWSWPG